MKPALPWFLQSTGGELKTGCVVLFTLPFLVGGLFCFYSMTWSPTINWLRAQQWEAVDAEIEKAWLDNSNSSDGDSYRVAVKYRYAYHGARHVGTRHSFMSTSTNVGAGGMRKTLEALRLGSHVTCWVDPENPAESVIDRSLPPLAVIGAFFSTPFITVGLVGLSTLGLPWLGRRLAAARKAELQELVNQGRLPAWVLRPFAPGFTDDFNDIALVTASDERMPQAVAVTVLNLFWNGMVGVFVCVDIISIATGESTTGWLLSLFLIPFVAVGLGILWSNVKLWRLTRRDRWVAALHPMPNFAGGETAFCWAWLNTRQRMYPPQAKVRIVAQAAQWDEESNSPSRMIGRKRRTKLTDAAASKKAELELTAVEVPTLDAAGEIPLTLPRVPLPSETLIHNSRWHSVSTWGGWWQLEVSYPDGTIEPADLTKAVKLA